MVPRLYSKVFSVNTRRRQIKRRQLYQHKWDYIDGKCYLLHWTERRDERTGEADDIESVCVCLCVLVVFDCARQTTSLD